MKFIITGGSGFIGTAIVNHLVENGHQVMGLDRKAPKQGTAEHEFREGDILDAALVEECFSTFQPEVLIHLAAHMSLREDGSDRRYLANTDGTKNLIDAAQACGSMRRSIFTSTKYIFRDGQPANPRDYNPDSTYGRSKVAMEKMIWETDGGGKEWCITRPTTIWGPGMSPHYQRFLRMVKSGKYFHIGRAPVRKHMGFVGNIAAQYEKLSTVDAELIHQKVFYATDYEPEVLREWAECFSRAFGGGELHTLPRPLIALGGKVGDVFKRCGLRKFPLTSFRIKNLTKDDLCDPSLTEEVCGPLPFTTEEGVAITAKWFSSLRG